MARRKKGNPVHGWVVLHKPVGMGSTPAVGFVRRVFGAQKAGHGGTLDPLAEGVLPIALGEATKTLPYVLESEKAYRVWMVFGSATSTDDKEGEVTQTSDVRPSKSDLMSVVADFTGPISQYPPAYSAVKIDGQPAYKKARKGEAVDIKPRDVTIFELTLEEMTEEGAWLVARVSKGTYIRSLVRDMGEKLGCYAHVGRLIRTKAGNFDISAAILPETLEKELEKGHIPETFLLKPDAVLDDIPALQVSTQAEATLKSGQVPPLDAPTGLCRLVAESGRLISLVNVDDAGEMRILRNFNLDDDIV